VLCNENGLRRQAILNAQKGFRWRRLNVLLACSAPHGTVATAPTSTTNREDYIARMVVGSFPIALSRSTVSARNHWFDEYVALTLQRDVRELSRIRQGPLLADLLRRLAGQTAQVLNVDWAARDVGLDASTTESYVRLLDAVFLSHRLPA
jgi:predicted AAA+ superfamily ATPase